MSRAVYFVKPVGMAGPIKIGCSYNPPNRCSTLMCWSPFPLEVMGVLPGAGAMTENRIHTLLWADHTHREWFAPTEAVLHTVAGLLDGSISIDSLPRALCKKTLNQIKAELAKPLTETDA